MGLKSGKEGTLDCKLHWYLKFYSHVILFIGSKSWVLLINIYWLGLKYLYPIFSINNYKLQKAKFCFGDVYKFIVHCLIPLDPCFIVYLYMCVYLCTYVYENLTGGKPSICNCKAHWVKIAIMLFNILVENF